MVIPPPFRLFVGTAEMRTTMVIDLPRGDLALAYASRSDAIIGNGPMSIMMMIGTWTMSGYRPSRRQQEVIGILPEHRDFSDGEVPSGRGGVSLVLQILAQHAQGV